MDTLYIQFHKAKNIPIQLGVNKDFVRRGGGNCFNVFYPPPPLKNDMMFIKLLVQVEFDLRFPLISGIYKLNLKKAPFPNLHYEYLFYIDYKDL